MKNSKSLIDVNNFILPDKIVRLCTCYCACANTFQIRENKFAIKTNFTNNNNTLFYNFALFIIFIFAVILFFALSEARYTNKKLVKNHLISNFIGVKYVYSELIIRKKRFISFQDLKKIIHD